MSTEPAVLQRYRDAEVQADRAIDAAKDALYAGDFDLTMEQLRAAEGHVVEAARLFAQLPVTS